MAHPYLAELPRLSCGPTLINMLDRISDSQEPAARKKAFCAALVVANLLGAWVAVAQTNMISPAPAQRPAIQGSLSPAAAASTGSTNLATAVSKVALVAEPNSVATTNVQPLAGLAIKVPQPVLSLRNAVNESNAVPAQRPAPPRNLRIVSSP